MLAVGVVAGGGLLLGANMLGLNIPYKVSCWFCSNRQTIKFSERNSWICHECDQYNGFDKDGDYNKEIRGQKTDVPVLMTKKFANSYEASKEGSTPKLCDPCNRNQELKMYQLKQFEPDDSNNEDEELAQYTAHLERTYRLCRSCEARVRQVIGEQDSKLKPKILSWKLSLFRKSPLNSAQDFSSSNIYWSPLTMTVLLTFAISIWLPSLLNTKLEFIPLNLKTRYEDLFGDWPNYFSYQELTTVIVPLALAIGYFQVPTSIIRQNGLHLIHILCWLLIFIQNAMEYSHFRCELASVCLFTILLVFTRTKPANREEKIQKKRSIRKRLYEQFDDCEEQEVEISKNPTPASTSIAESPTPSQPFDLYLPNHEICQKSEQCDISTLQIDGQDLLGNLRPASPAFSLKQYNTSNETMIDFGMRQNDSFIKPARFVYNEKNRIAQSSWVAGGYWHSKQNPELNETLSRTSSQSSGFGSLTSAFGLQQQEKNNVFEKNNLFASLPNSRLNSVCGDERFSVFSEPAYKFNNSVNATLVSNDPRKSMLATIPQISSFRSRSVLGDDDDSFNSSKFSQEAFGKLQPQAESSPIDKTEKKKDVSFLERKITIDISMYSLFLFLSVGVNISLSTYFLYTYLL